MRKFTLICATLILSALALQTPLTNWGNTPSVTKAETPGQDGDLTVTAANTVVNRYATLTVDAAAGATSITVANGGGSAGLDPATLLPGNLLLIIQMQGAQIDTTDTAAYGTITDLRNAGRYEFLTVGSVSGNVITLACGGLRFGYTVTGKVQVIRVPQYSNLTVNAGASITSPAWNGSIGGVVATSVQNNAVINGRIDVSGLGFRGGQLSANGIGFGSTLYRTTNVDLGGEKGEGIVGNGPVYDTLNGRFGRGAPANAGGGGTAHNTGGGGGANGNNGNAYTGAGVMDTTVVGASAWSLDPEDSPPANSSGGGRGGYSYSDPLLDQNALVVGPGNPLWEGDFRRPVGGRGGHPVPEDPAGRIFAGGGGGAAHQNNLNGGAGGNGGGIVFFLGNVVSGTGQIQANGSNGGDSVDQHRDGAGGGGGGGTVVAVANSIAGVSVEARGGNGGTHGRPIGRFGHEAHGPGGGGGGGFVALSGGTPATNVSGGSHGVSLADTVTEFPVNGATRGATGVGNSPIVAIPFACATDLSILKTSDLITVNPGQSITYSIVATNSGPNAVVGARVVDTLPATLLNGSWTCTATAGSVCGAASGTGNINTTVNLLVNGKATFVMTATISPSAVGTVSNTATVSSPAGAVDPTPGNNTSTYTVNVSRGVTEGLRTSLTPDDICVGAGRFETVRSTVTNNGPGTQGDNAGPEYTAQIPAQLELVSNSCTATIGTCTTSGNNVTWDGTLAAGQSVQIVYQVRVRSSVSVGTRFCVTSRINYDSDGNGTNDTTQTVTTCDTADCAPKLPGTGVLGPGTPIVDRVVNDQLPGSVLIFPIYTSSTAQANLSNTRLTITNTSTTSPVVVHLFFVDGASCNVSDFNICLTANQTGTMLASDVDPGTTGYVVAVASDFNGCPLSFNFLIGEEYVKTTIGNAPFFGNLNAEGVQALFEGTLPGCDANSVTATLLFNGVAGGGYALLPRVLALDSILSRADGNSTWLIVDRIGGSLATTAATLGTLFGVLYDSGEEAASFNLTGGCQLRGVLSNDLPRTSPRFELKIPSNSSGWLKLWSQSDIAIIGSAFNSNTTATGFNGGHNLHKLTLTAAGSYVIPIFPGGC